MTEAFGARLAQAMDAHGPLCLGIDPHEHLLEAWGLPHTPSGLETFSLRVIEAAAEQPVAALKPQVAFYEAFGSAGFRVLERVLAEARSAGILSIADAKRGDIGSTMAGYARAWLTEGAALEADALTLSPYLGYESLRPAIDMALQKSKGVFVLGLTSNPEGASVQHMGTDKTSVAGTIIDQVAAENATSGGLGSIGLVIGATVAEDAESLGINLAGSRAPLLAPGYGSQGATATDLATGFKAAWPQVLVNSSRAILRQGPDTTALVTAIKETQTDLDSVSR